MYMLTLSAAAVLNSDHRRVVLYAMVGVMWGWAVAGVAFLPYALLLLLVGAPIVYLPAGVVFLVGTVTPMVAFDRLFYGKWTVSSVACSAHVCVLAIRLRSRTAPVCIPNKVCSVVAESSKLHLQQQHCLLSVCT